MVKQLKKGIKKIIKKLNREIKRKRNSAGFLPGGIFIGSLFEPSEIYTLMQILTMIDNKLDKLHPDEVFSLVREYCIKEHEKALNEQYSNPLVDNDIFHEIVGRKCAYRDVLVLCNVISKNPIKINDKPGIYATTH